MNILKQLSNRFSTIRELLIFFWEIKMWWMIPFVLVLIILGILIVFAHATPLGPLIYAAF